MCYNCGCGSPYDDMGSPDNITNNTFSLLAKKWNKSEEETKRIIYSALKDNTFTSEEEELFQKAAKAWGQSVEEAKKKTQEMLKKDSREKT